MRNHFSVASPGRAYWNLQMAAWAACVLVSALATLPNLAYPAYVLYRVVLTLACLLATLPLMWTCRWLWSRARRLRSAAIVVSLAYLLGYACAVVAEWSMRLFAAAQAPPPQSGIAFAALTGALSPWALLCAWALMYFGYCYYDAERLARERLGEATALAREAELRALRYQIQPHFMFNTLNAISTLVYTRHNDAAMQMLTRFGDFLRLTLDVDAAEEVSVAEELQLALSYVEIERARLGERLQLSTQIDPAALDLAMPPLLLQPLVENAIRHGIAPVPGAARLQIVIRRDVAQLRLIVRNDGLDLVTRDGQVHHGVGLANVTARLRQLYGQEWRLDLRCPAEGGCEVVLELPARVLAAAAAAA